MLLAANENYNAEQATGKKNTAENGGTQNMILEVNGMKYVQADRQVLYGNDANAWGQQIERYIHNEIRHGHDVSIPTTNGETIKITADTEGKSSFRNDVVEEGNRRKMTDSEYETKLNAEAHIDELVSISARGKKNTPDYGGIHGSKASGGFNYRTAYFRDFDKKYYRLRISVMEGTDGKIAYNIGEVKERSFPSNVNGSSAKSGAPGGETSNKSKPQTSDLVKNPNTKFVPGHQFQMFENVEETDKLVAVHNKSVSGLRRMLQRGGVPFPSIAIKKAGAPHEGFGDISIVFPRSTIDRTSCHNCVQQKGRLEAFPLSVFLYFAVCKPYFLRV